MYGDAFCKIYNEFGWNYFPETFAEQLLLWMKERDFHAKSLLDIGCGTGILCGKLNQQGIEATGIDLSESMIEIAKVNSPKCSFEVANMITYRPEKRFDLITCTGDAINHIIELSDVRRVFENVHHLLNPGGYFITDLLDEKEVGNGDVIDFNYDEGTDATFKIANDEGHLTLTVDVFKNGEPEFEEKITEIIHEPAVIRSYLEDLGFADVTLSHKLLKAQEQDAVTWFLVARK